MEYHGSCHCGAVQVDLTLAWPPERAPVRACDCSFCRAHGARTVTDPDGRAEIRVRDSGSVSRYRFGLETADFLVCSVCGVYVAALAETAAGPRATVNVNALDARAVFAQPAPSVSYAGETPATRLRRRAAGWTPAVFHG